MEQNQNQAILELNYIIPKEDYVYYNLLYASEELSPKRRKAYLIGGIELVTGLIMLYTVLTSSMANKDFLIVLTVMLAALGIYSLSFHSLIFPKSLKKEAEKQYEKNTYLKSNINLSFYSNKIEEKGEGVEKTYKWNEIERFAQSEKLYFITIKGTKSIIIPKSQIGDDSYMVEELFSTISEKYKKTYKKWKEPVYK